MPAVKQHSLLVIKVLNADNTRVLPVVVKERIIVFSILIIDCTIIDGPVDGLLERSKYWFLNGWLGP